VRGVGPGRVQRLGVRSAGKAYEAGFFVGGNVVGCEGYKGGGAAEHFGWCGGVKGCGCGGCEVGGWTVLRGWYGGKLKECSG